MINIGYFNIFLAGDIENKSIEALNSSDLCNIDYLKNPHHGSSSLDKMISQIEINNYNISSLATTTTYSKHQLPEKKSS